MKLLENNISNLAFIVIFIIACHSCFSIYKTYYQSRIDCRNYGKLLNAITYYDAFDSQSQCYIKVKGINITVNQETDLPNAITVIEKNK